MPEQAFHQNVSTQPPQALNIRSIEDPPPLGAGVYQKAIRTPAHQPRPIVGPSIASNMPSMGFSNDARNLVEQPIGANTGSVPSVPQTVLMAYQANQQGLGTHYPRDMGSSHTSLDYGQNGQAFGGFYPSSSSSGDYPVNYAGRLPNGYPSITPLAPYNDQSHQFRRSSLGQPRSAYPPPPTPTDLRALPFSTSSMQSPMINTYQHLSAGQLPGRAVWSRDGNPAMIPNLVTPMNFPRQQGPRHDGQQHNAYQLQMNMRCLDDTNLYVGRLPNSIEAKTLQRIFGRCGPIVEVTQPRPPNNP